MGHMINNYVLTTMALESEMINDGCINGWDCRLEEIVWKNNALKYELLGLLLKLKLQYFGYLMQIASSLEKTLMLGKIESKRRGWQMMRWLDSITNSMDMNMSKLQETVKDRGAWHAATHGVTKSWTQLSDWTTTNAYPPHTHAITIGNFINSILILKLILIKTIFMII